MMEVQFAVTTMAAVEAVVKLVKAVEVVVKSVKAVEVGKLAQQNVHLNGNEQCMEMAIYFYMYDRVRTFCSLHVYKFYFKNSMKSFERKENKIFEKVIRKMFR